MSSKKFILNSDQLGRVTLQDDPIGWDATKQVFTRNLKYVGVFRKRTATLKFIGDGLQYCTDLFNIRGTEAVLNVIVMAKVDYEDAWELEFEGIGKFNPFKLDWADLLNPSLSIEFEDSGFHNRFLTRVNMDVNVGVESSIEGLALGAVSTQDIQVSQRVINEYNKFQISVNKSYYFLFVSPGDPYIISERGQVIPVEKVSGETEFIQTPIDYLLDNPGVVCDFVTQVTALKIRYNIAGEGETFRIDDPVEIDAPLQVGWYLRVFHDSSDLDNFTDTLLHEIDGMHPDGQEFDFSFNGEVSLTLNVGEACTVVGEFEKGIAGPKFYTIQYQTCDLFVDLVQFFNEYVSKCHYRYEFMKRLVQIITDQDDCFKSNVFGRTDIGYLNNGKWWNNVVFNGKQLRGFDEFPVRSFEKSFKSARAIWNVGCGIEKFGSKYKVVVEDITHFFRGDISITLHNVRKIGRDIREDFTFSEVNVGYEKSEYEQVNGLEEYNNKSKFATYIKSDENILDLVSPDRADPYGMEFARRKSIIVAGSEDTPYDNEIFTAMVKKDGTLLRTEKNENYDTVENIQSPETATNLDITPQRNLLRNSDWISGCVYKFPEEFLKFLSADKPTDLITQRTGEDEEVAEQTSIQNNKLLSSLWLNLENSFEADIVPSQIRAIEAKPNSLVKWSPFSREQTTKYYYGWILEANVGGKERSGSFVLLAANVTSDRLKIIDPEGIWNGEEETPLPPGPPGETEFGFEYGFEKVFES